MKSSTIIKHASSHLKLSKTLHLHARRRKSSQCEDADPTTPSCEARRFFKMKIRKMSPP
jgi:hypothetical protein